MTTTNLPARYMLYVGRLPRLPLRPFLGPGTFCRDLSKEITFAAELMPRQYRIREAVAACFQIPIEELKVHLGDRRYYVTHQDKRLCSGTLSKKGFGRPSDMQRAGYKALALQRFSDAKRSTMHKTTPGDVARRLITRSFQAAPFVPHPHIPSCLIANRLPHYVSGRIRMMNRNLSVLCKRAPIILYDSDLEVDPADAIATELAQFTIPDIQDAGPLALTHMCNFLNTDYSKKVVAALAFKEKYEKKQAFLEELMKVELYSDVFN